MIARVLIVISLTACAASGPEQHNTLDSIPRAAAASLRTEAAGAEIAHVTREREGGQELYEGAWSEGGLRREVKVTADGKVVEREREIAPGDVPVAVRTAASQALPAGGPISYVLLGNGNYEAETVVAGKEHEAVFKPDGSRGSDEHDGPDGDDDDDDDDEHDEHD